MIRTIFFCLCISFLQDSSLAQPQELEALTIEDGLSQGLVTSVIQTRDGFIWLATQVGLNRYDGIRFIEFSTDPFNPYSLRYNDFAYLSEDSRGWMWILFGNGRDTDVYDPESGRFYHLKMELPNELEFKSAWCEDPTGAMWLGGNRLEVSDDFLKKATGSILEVELEKIVNNGREGLYNMSLKTLLASDSTLYLLTNEGFYTVDWMNKQIDTLHIFKESLKNRKDNPLEKRQGNAIIEDSYGQIWVSLDKIYYLPKGQLLEGVDALIPTNFPEEKKGNLFEVNGQIYTIQQELSLFSPQEAMAQKGQITTIIEKENKQQLMFYSPFKDQTGIVWMGTNGYGLRKYNPTQEKFQHYLPGKSMRSIFLDAEGKIWREFMERPLEQIDLESGKIIKKMGKDDWNLDLMQGEKGHYWIVGEESGEWANQLFLLRIDGQTGAEKWYPSDANFMSENPNKIHRAFMEDRKIWLLGNDSLACFTIDTEQFEYFDLSKSIEKNKLSAPNFTTFIKTGEREFWAGSYTGLFRIDLGVKTNEAEIKHFNTRPSDPQSLNYNHIWSLCSDPEQPEQYLWVGTAGGGLNRLDKTTSKFQHFTKKDGLPNDVIYAILPGTKNDLWMSSNFGLSNFDPTTEHFTNFSAVDGLQSNEFNSGSSHRAKDGTLFFGGVNGFNMFHPDSLQLNRQIPPIVITGLRVHTELVDYRTSFTDNTYKSILTKPIEHTKTVELSYTQNFISFEYAALDYNDPSQNRYRYQLVGADPNWVEVVGEAHVQYANLQPGQYIFKVIGSNNDGIWNEEPATLEIIILPPWWQTKLAYAAYLLAIIGGLFWVYTFQVRRAKERNQLAYEKKETERLSELDRIKTNFFSNVTHEFRTPLTLILEPVRQMLKEDLNGKFAKRLSLVKNNGEKMLALVNQLLDMSKIEGGKMELDIRRGNILETIRPIYQSFLVLAEKKGIVLKMSGTKEIEEFYIDQTKVEKILANLLSNAIKFTEVGSVEVITKVTKLQNMSTFSLVVSDTGKGIPAPALAHIFDRFYQVDASSTRVNEGTGIGLALTKELVELMGGTIQVKSEVDKGTTFTVTLPIRLEQEVSSITESAKRSSKTVSIFEKPLLAAVPQRSFAEIETNHSSIPQGTGKYLILFIEDNTELRQFFRSIFDKQHQVIEASNGTEGIRKAKDLIPDLIVSDVMMPEKDGYEVCEDLKNDWLTSHIPIILLTAKSAIDSKIKGLRTGADAYLTKPFHTEELQVRIEKLIEGRKHLQEKFNQAPKGQSILKSAAQLPKIENDFLRNLTLIVEERMDDENLSVESLAEKVFMSRSQLFRKVKALTNQSPNEFVRNYRLDRGMELIKNKEGNVIQVSMMVGFGDEKYFSKRFKERFGKSPSEV